MPDVIKRSDLSLIVSVYMKHFKSLTTSDIQMLIQWGHVMNLTGAVMSGQNKLVPHLLKNIY